MLYNNEFNYFFKNGIILAIDTYIEMIKLIIGIL